MLPPPSIIAPKEWTVVRRRLSHLIGPQILDSSKLPSSTVNRPGNSGELGLPQGFAEAVTTVPVWSTSGALRHS